MTSIISAFLMDHLELYAQPIVDSISKKVYFYEILSRVRYKNKLYYPDEFIFNMSISMRLELAKTLLIKIGELQKKHPNISFSLNISALEVDMKLDKFLISLYEENSIDPQYCIIEITEQAALDDLRIYNILKNLKNKYGFRFAVDDFGTKFAVLNHVVDKNKEKVFDYIKIDGSLIENIEHDHLVYANLCTYLHFIKQNEKKAIVEYIASEAIYNIVKQLEPDFLQGFFFGEPKPIHYYLPIVPANSNIGSLDMVQGK